MGPHDPELIAMARGLIWRFGKPAADSEPRVEILSNGQIEDHVAAPCDAADALQNVSLIRTRC